MGDFGIDKFELFKSIIKTTDNFNAKISEEKKEPSEGQNVVRFLSEPDENIVLEDVKLDFEDDNFPFNPPTPN